MGSKKGNGCKGIKWYCDSTTESCYASYGKGQFPWGRGMLRVECYSPNNCQMEVYLGRQLFEREYDVPGMKIAKQEACKRMRKTVG